MATILLVDDELQVLEGIQRVLRQEPYEVLAVTSGAKALDILKSQEIDVIISDETMPIMRGAELLKICRDEYPDIIRIMLTGKTNKESTMKAIYNGWVYQYLQKSMDPKDLLAVLHDALILRSLRKDKRPEAL